MIKLGSPENCYLCGTLFSRIEGNQQAYRPVNVCDPCSQVKRSSEEIEFIKRKHQNEVDRMNANAETTFKIVVSVIIFGAGFAFARYLGCS